MKIDNVTELAYNKHMENKTIDNGIDSYFGDFERKFAAMHDPSPDEIREFIATVILSSAHDSSLVDSAFKWVESKNNKSHFTFDAKTTEEWNYKLTEEEKDRFKHLPTPCAVIGFKPKNINYNIKITKDVRRIRIEPDFLGVGEQEETYYTYTVTCYIDGEEIDSVSTKSIIEAGEIAQSYETFIKYYNKN